MQALNSQLLKESAALDWTQGAGHTTAAAAATSSESGPSYSGPHARLMTATAASSGQTLAQLSSHDPITGAPSAAADGQIPGMGHVDPTTAAAEAAMARLGTPHAAHSADASLSRPQSSDSKESRPWSPDTEPQQQHVHPGAAPAGHCCDGALHESSTRGTTEPDAATSMELDTHMATPPETSAPRDLSTEQDIASAAAPAAAAESISPLEQCHEGDQPEAASAREIDPATAFRPDQPASADEASQTSAPAHERHNASERPTADQSGAAPAQDADSSQAAASQSAASQGACSAIADPAPASFGNDDDDPGAARYQRAERAAQDLVREAGGSDGARALATLATILQVWQSGLSTGVIAKATSLAVCQQAVSLDSMHGSILAVTQRYMCTLLVLAPRFTHMETSAGLLHAPCPVACSMLSNVAHVVRC